MKKLKREPLRPKIPIKAKGHLKKNQRIFETNAVSNISFKVPFNWIKMSKYQNEDACGQFGRL